MFYKVFHGICFLLLLCLIFQTDDTDLSVFRRSNLGLKTDYGTGNQYLVTFWGGITPRLDENGNIVNIYRKRGE